MSTSHKNTSIFGITILFAILIFIVPSCSKDNTAEPIVYTTYVSHELLTSYSSAGTKTLFQIIQGTNPEVSNLIDKIQYDVSVYKVIYLTPFKGELIEASGLVCIPVTDGGDFSMISFQNGTNTAHDAAPTSDYTNILFKYLESSASLGYIMLIPDYIGFGSSKQFVHPYLHKESTTSSVENLIVAAGEMINSGIVSTTWDNEVYLMGYSQGGWATLATHKYLAQKEELTFDVKASSCGAGPYNLSTVQNFMFSGTTYTQPVYMAYTGISYKSLGLISNPITDYFNEPYATPLPSYFNGTKSNGQINSLLNDTVSVLVANSFITGINTDTLYHDFREAMNNNSVYGWNTTEPIQLYHGLADALVPPTTTIDVYQEFMDAGASENVTYIPFPDKNHTSVAIPMVINSLVWFNELENNSTKLALIK